MSPGGLLMLDLDRCHTWHDLDWRILDPVAVPWLWTILSNLIWQPLFAQANPTHMIAATGCGNLPDLPHSSIFLVFLILLLLMVFCTFGIARKQTTCVNTASTVCCELFLMPKELLCLVLFLLPAHGTFWIQYRAP